MEDQEEDNCTATNLSTDDTAELRDIVNTVVSTPGGDDALALFPRFQKLVRENQPYFKQNKCILLTLIIYVLTPLSSCIYYLPSL
jgi:hypothetical protein